MNLITENFLDEWVRGHSREAQGLVVELVWRLVAASSPRPTNRRFPLGDSIGQHGPDGELNTEYPYEPFIPEGRSYWEIGTSIDAQKKANGDYLALTKAVPVEVRATSTFIFVTPLSGRRDFPADWRGENQLAWIARRQQRGEWKDVRIIDGTKLTDWLHHVPAVELWFAKQLGIAVEELEVPGEHWRLLKSAGAPPDLPAELFLIDRQEACERLDAVLADEAVQLRLETRHPEQVIDFVSAYIASLEAERQADVAGRCLIVSGPHAWNEIVSRREPHVLIADPTLDVSSEGGSKLLEKALRGGHRIVYGSVPGGARHSTSVSLRNPEPYLLERTLRDAGFADERARTVARKSYGNLGVLVRSLKDVPTTPSWANGPRAADLMIAMLLGGWNERFPADIKVVEKLSRRSYHDWVTTLREVATKRDAPVTHQDGVWKFVSLSEGWDALGGLIYDSHLGDFFDAAEKVLGEDDPALGLTKERRAVAGLLGQGLTHSATLRGGVATTLALLGARPDSLTSCAIGLSASVSSRIVRSVLKDATSKQWASINELLPLLAEGAPLALLESVDAALGATPSPFVAVFKEEDSGVFGQNYMTGLLWGLESLAWERAYLGQVVDCLAELATLDPGGRWVNRPINSLITIFLPWQPQTCASYAERLSAVSLVAKSARLQHVGWKLLLGLMPNANTFSNGGHKPTWRISIPDDWSGAVSDPQYWEQTSGYIGLALEVAAGKPGRLADLLDHMASFPPPQWEQTVELLDSKQIAGMAERERYGLWRRLEQTICQHRLVSDAAWAMRPEQLDRLSVISHKLTPPSPQIRSLSLFDPDDSTNHDAPGDWRAHVASLAMRRQDAIRELLDIGNETLLTFISEVSSPYLVGTSWGELNERCDDGVLLPHFLIAGSEAMQHAARGYVQGRFSTGGWHWLDSLSWADWQPAEVAHLFTYLPFTPDAWTRVEAGGQSVSKQYWLAIKVWLNVEPEHTLECALKLLENDRPFAALRLLHRAMRDKKQVPTDVLTRAFQDAIQKETSVSDITLYELGELVQQLQGRTDADPDALCQIEWQFLSVLDFHRGMAPVVLHRRLAQDPETFCGFLKLAFRSIHHAPPSDSGAETEKPENEQEEQRASQAYRLLTTWRTCPGVGPDGFVVEADFRKWLAAIKAKCTESGHLKVALAVLGRCLAHAPAGQGGLWIDAVVAEALNERDADAMREGMVEELFGSRGTYGFSGGAEEARIAQRYRDQAAAVATAGFNRLASHLRQLADSYALQAERDEKRGASTAE